MNTWLDEHLETFVRPVLGSIPNLPKTVTLTPITLRSLHAVWKEIKRLSQGRTILLPGRDVWLVEVIARMQNDHPTLFRQEISSCVAKSGLLTDDFSKYHALDTGYSGSVPQALKTENWHLITWSACCRALNETDEVFYKRRAVHMLFPRRLNFKYDSKTGKVAHKGSPLANLCSILEASAKYWDRGEVTWKVGPGGISKAVKILPQKLSEKTFFKQAAILTMIVANSCKPHYAKRYHFISMGRYL